MPSNSIYILDDEILILNLLSTICRDNGFQTYCFDNAKDFLAHDGEISPEDILILDLAIPDFDGLELLREYSRTRRSLRVIIMSGADSGTIHAAEMLAKAYGIEVLSTLTKPVDINHFVEVLKANSK